MMIEHITGHLIIIMAPMASGKSSLIARVQSKFPEIVQTVSCTTRSIRPQERDGVDYYFITKEVFQKKIDEGLFIEWAHFSGNLYGTLTSELVDRLQAGAVVICEIELQGVLQLLKFIPSEYRTVVYIDGGDWDTLKARALARAPISESDLALRFERYQKERASKDFADVVINNTNENFEKAKTELCTLVEKIITRVASPS